MKKVPGKQQSPISGHTIRLSTLTAVLVVAAGLLMASYAGDTGFTLSNLADAHRNHQVLFLFDLLPLALFLILKYAGQAMQQRIDTIAAELEKTGTLLEQNTSFARALAEGENPPAYPEMLQSELGQALKLIHLNINSNRRKEREVTWITEGKEIISRVLRLHNQLDELSCQILKSLSKYIGAIQGAVYLFDEEQQELRNIAVLAYNRRKYTDQRFRMGEGLVGQCAYEMDYIYRTEIPDDYVTITSGILGDQKPKSILLVPLITNDALQGIVEFAFLEPKITRITIQFMLELGEIIAQTFFNLRVNEKTHTLLEESREMTAALQKNEQILQQNAEEMKDTQEQLRSANIQLQKKIEEEQLSQNRLHALLENASEIISVYDDSFSLKYISPSVEHILGYTPEEMMKGKDFERIDRESSTEIRKAFDQLKRDPTQHIRIEYSFVRKDGKRIFLSSNIRNLLDAPSIKGFIFNSANRPIVIYPNI